MTASRAGQHDVPKGSPGAVAALMSTLSQKTKNDLSTPAKALLNQFGTERLQIPAEVSVSSVVLKEPLTILDEEGKREQSRVPRGTKVAAPTPSEPTKEDTVSLIDAIKDGVIGPKVREMKYLFAIHSMYYVFVISAGIVVNLSPTAATAIGTLGLGSLAIGANYNNLQSAVDKYLNDRRHMLDSLEQIEALEGFERKDFPEGVQKAYDAAMALLKSLTQSPSSNSP